jgi:hypothetical protein
MNEERFIEKAVFIREENYNQVFQGESGRLYFLSGIVRNNDKKIGDSVDVYYKIFSPSLALNIVK